MCETRRATKVSDQHAAVSGEVLQAVVELGLQGHLTLLGLSPVPVVTSAVLRKFGRHGVLCSLG